MIGINRSGKHTLFQCIHIIFKKKEVTAMSLITPFEKNARYAVVISTLNNIRHWITDREGSVLSKDDIGLFNFCRSGRIDIKYEGI